MKKKIFFSLLGVMLLVLIPGALWANSQNDLSKDTPAILVSLGQANAIPLDDMATAAVRGQAQYVLVKVFGLNMFDFGRGVQWTWNPLGYRYGNWGGPGYGAGSTVDQMDFYFSIHDGYYSTPNSAAVRLQADKDLRDALLSLPYTLDGRYSGDWGQIYVTSPADAPESVNVFGLSLIGGKIFSGWKEMPYTEYSRREAVYGIQLMILGKSVLRLN